MQNLCLKYSLYCFFFLDFFCLSKLQALQKILDEERAHKIAEIMESYAETLEAEKAALSAERNKTVLLARANMHACGAESERSLFEALPSIMSHVCFRFF